MSVQSNTMFQVNGASATGPLLASVSIDSSALHCKAVLQGFGNFGLGATPNSSLLAFATPATPVSSTFPQPQLSATATPSASSPFAQVHQGGLSSLSTAWSSPAPAPAVISTSSGFGQSAALGFGAHTPSARFLARLIVRLRFDSYDSLASWLGRIRSGLRQCSSQSRTLGVALWWYSG